MARVTPKQVPHEDLTSSLAFPMWVVPIVKMAEIARSGKPLPSHEELMADGCLCEWKKGMKTIFFSQ